MIEQNPDKFLAIVRELTAELARKERRAKAPLATARFLCGKSPVSASRRSSAAITSFLIGLGCGTGR
jgi:hypothetical protein